MEEPQDAIIKARDFDVCPDIIFKAAAENNERIPPACSSIKFQTLDGNTRELWSVDSKKNIPIDWVTKSTKSKLSR